MFHLWYLVEVSCFVAVLALTISWIREKSTILHLTSSNVIGPSIFYFLFLPLKILSTSCSVDLPVTLLPIRVPLICQVFVHLLYLVPCVLVLVLDRSVHRSPQPFWG